MIVGHPGLVPYDALGKSDDVKVTEVRKYDLRAGKKESFGTQG